MLREGHSGSGPFPAVQRANCIHAGKCQWKMVLYADRQRGAIVFVAMMSDKVVSTHFAPSVSSDACSALTKHYIVPVYLLVIK